MTRPSNAPAYKDDFAAWLEDQALHARRGETDALDLRWLPGSNFAASAVRD
jgi:hypothetical protein